MFNNWRVWFTTGGLQYCLIHKLDFRLIGKTKKNKALGNYGKCFSSLSLTKSKVWYAFKKMDTWFSNGFFKSFQFS